MERRKSVYLSFLMAAVLLVVTPSCSADVFSGISTTASPSRPSSAQASQSSFSSVVFPVYGNVFPNEIYYVSIEIGNPQKIYFLDIDTGSDVTWIQCDAPCKNCYKGPNQLYDRPAKNQLLPCEHPMCEAVQKSTDGECEAADDQCHYEIEYQDNSSSLGVLIAGAFQLPLSNKTLANRNLAFGCGYDQLGWGTSTDGILGLGRGKIGVVSQLRDLGVCRSVVGHCLRRKSGSFLFIGDYVDLPGFIWAPMSSVEVKYYSPGLATVFAGKEKLGDKQAVVFDSGSSYTYFVNQMYQSLISLIRSYISKTSLKQAPKEKSLSLCWKDAKPFSSVFQLNKYFPSIFLNFRNGKAVAQLVIHPENYFIVTEQGNACLGILNGTDLGMKDFNLIGDISMQDMTVVYDNENHRIGWAAGCDWLKSGNPPPS